MVTTACVAFPVRSRANPRLIATVILRNPNQRSDNVLTGLVHRLGIDGTGPEAIARLQTFIDLRKSSLGRIRGVFIYDETGNWLATSEAVSLKGLNNGDRDYFRHHAQSDDHRTLIGRPVKSRSGGQWIITVSRRFNHPDGRFAGVVLATVDVAYFSQFFKKFNIGQNGSVALLSTDGIVLARHPDDGSYVGRDLSNTPLFNDRGSYPATAAFYFKSPLDGVRRLSVYKVSDHFPVLIVATKAQDEVLAAWRRDAAVRMMFVIALLLVISVIGFFFVRELHARQRLAAELQAKEAVFRLLAEESSDMVTRIGTDERIHHISRDGWRFGDPFIRTARSCPAHFARAHPTCLARSASSRIRHSLRYSGKRARISARYPSVPDRCLRRWRCASSGWLAPIAFTISR
jgi:hypothetical protein